MKIGGKGFGIEATHSEKSRDAVDLGLAEIPDIAKGMDDSYAMIWK